VTAYVVNEGVCDGGHTVTPIRTATGTQFTVTSGQFGPCPIEDRSDWTSAAHKWD